MRLRDRVALITGAGGGIGRAIARAFAREGAAVVVNDADDAAARAVAAELRAGGTWAASVAADAADLDAHERLLAPALGEFGRVDVLVVNASFQAREAFLAARTETFDRTMGLNVRGAFFLARRVAAEMARTGGGRVIAIGSVHDEVPLRDHSAYAISKAALGMMVRALALELGPLGINVNAVSPGAIATARNPHLAEPEPRRSMAARIPLGRVGEPEDVAGAVVFLASPEAGYVTGTTIYADGGLRLGG